MAGKKGSKHYPLELKLEAMRLFYEEGKTRNGLEPLSAYTLYDIQTISFFETTILLH